MLLNWSLNWSLNWRLLFRSLFWRPVTARPSASSRPSRQSNRQLAPRARSASSAPLDVPSRTRPTRGVRQQTSISSGKLTRTLTRTGAACANAWTMIVGVRARHARTCARAERSSALRAMQSPRRFGYIRGEQDPVTASHRQVPRGVPQARLQNRLLNWLLNRRFL